MMSDADVEEQIRTSKNGDDGKELTPSFTKLGDSKIKALAAYIRAFLSK
jgi:mono/diheme cytochrome c family protein